MRRVVITGLGVVCPCGNSVTDTWDSIANGRSGIRPITRFDASEYSVRFAGEVRDFDAQRYIEKKRLREMDTFIHYAIAAGDMAVKASGIEPTEAQAERVGTLVGVGLGGLGLIQEMAQTLQSKGPKRISPYFIPASLANLAPGQLSMRFGFKGTSYTTTSACASGAHAIGEGFRAIQLGTLDACLAGGAEATICGLAVAGFAQMRALSTRNDAPEAASRPYDVDRDGFVIAEGAALVMLEERQYALARGATILAEVVGYGSTADAHHMTNPAPEGEGAQRSMRLALAEAKLNPEDIDYLNAHATSTDVGDRNELLAIRNVFGAGSGPMVSATKSMTGHLLGAAGALESVLCVLSLSNGVVPPTINLEKLDPDAEGVDIVRGSAREASVNAVMNNSFGFGGTNATLIFKRPS
ncbi:MAG TPA: beta-ketoacyl-ACP synthase II [Polyangiaceae bacterium]